MSVPKAASQPVKSAARTIELLDYFARNPGLHSLAQLQEGLGYPRSSLYVLLRTLVDLDWLETDTTGTLYRIGLRALLVGTSYIDTDEVVRVAGEALDELARHTDETVHLGRLDGGDVVYLATRASPQYLRPFSRIGRRLPAHAVALGKALLADRSDSQVSELLPAKLARLTPNTLTPRTKLIADLKKTRERGYALDEQENTIGLRCIAVPLRYQRPARDAISISVPSARFTPDREHEFVSYLMAARERIEWDTRHITRH